VGVRLVACSGAADHLGVRAADAEEPLDGRVPEPQGLVLHARGLAEDQVDEEGGHGGPSQAAQAKDARRVTVVVRRVSKLAVDTLLRILDVAAAE
jgi:hypothetical protein